MMTWEKFHPYVLPSVAGCPALTLNHHIKTAATDFYTASRAWYEPTTYATSSLQASYPLTTSADRVAIGIQNAEIIGGKRLDIGYDAEIEEDTSAGTPTRFYTSDLQSFTLFPVPAISEIQIKVAAYYAPSFAAVGIDDRLFALHKLAIADRAMSTLLMLPAKPWTNPGLAGEKARGWGAAINHGSFLAQTGGARLRVRGVIL